MKKMICVLLIGMLLLNLAVAEEASVSTIGGADAPTEITVAATDTTDEIEPDAEAGGMEIVEIVGPVASEQAIAMDEPKPSPNPAQRLAGIIIGIDPGHQAHANSAREPIAPGSSEKKAKVSSGTAGVRTGIAEYVTDLEISLKLRDALEALGCTVYMTRETNDVDISNLERATMMNELNAQLVLRLHCDGSENRSANGIGMFIRKTGAAQQESEAAAEMLLETMTQSTGARARGIFKRDTYTGLNWSTVPCILVEMGFMSNPEEDEKLNDPEYQMLLVEGFVEGICRYFER